MRADFYSTDIKYLKILVALPRLSISSLKISPNLKDKPPTLSRHSLYKDILKQSHGNPMERRKDRKIFNQNPNPKPS